MNNPVITLAKGREKSLLRHHPWIFSGAIQKIAGSPASGDTVEVVASNGTWLARGAFSPQSQISVRIWTFDENEEIDTAFFERKIKAALDFRDIIFNPPVDACRLIAAESDSLPGLVVDRYGKHLIAQFLAAGVEKHKMVISDALQRITGCHDIFERSDVAVRKLEGLPEVKGVISGETPPLLEICEDGVRYEVDLVNGHKTGFYLDQRVNRDLVKGCASGKQVLNCFSYTGGFGVAAAVGGASFVTNVDSSETSLEQADANMKRNGIPSEKYRNISADVFSILRKFRAEGDKFDLIILDPPKFADSMRNMDKACRGYKDIAILGWQLLRPGGTLFTFSCSGLITPDLFLKITADAAIDAGFESKIITRLFQSPDHACSLTFPESLYLKGLHAVKL